MSADLERQVMNAVVMYQQKNKWKQWGLNQLRKQGAAILLHGPSGTGKTVIAEYLAVKVRHKGIKEISFGDFGSHVPGENARQIRRLFNDARERGDMTIFIDECEAVLWDRSKAGANAMWMLEVIDELLVQIGKYPGLIILATNRLQMLDKALERRLLAIIEVPIPLPPERAALWKSKLPSDFPIRLSLNEIEKIATLQITGAEVETCIINVASDAIRENKKPTFQALYEEAKSLANCRVNEEKIQ